MVYGCAWPIALARSGPAVVDPLNARGVADSNLLMVLAVVFAACGAAIVFARSAARARTQRAWIPAAGPHDAASHSALIEELLRSARIAHREGIGALAHPLHRSADHDVQYAIDLVCSRADPRIVRGVLVDRMLDRARPAPRPFSARRRVAAVTSLSLTGLLSLAAHISHHHALLQISRALFATCCLGASLWCIASAGSSSRSRAAGGRHPDDRKHSLILSAAEGIARGEPPAVIEQTLRGQPVLTPPAYSLSSAA